MVGFCECGNESSSFINCGEFLEQLLTCWLLRMASAPLNNYVCKWFCNMNHCRCFSTYKPVHILYYISAIYDDTAQSLITIVVGQL